MVDAHVSGACAARREGSSPFLGTPKDWKSDDFQSFFIFIVTDNSTTLLLLQQRILYTIPSTTHSEENHRCWLSVFHSHHSMFLYVLPQLSFFGMNHQPILENVSPAPSFPHSASCTQIEYRYARCLYCTQNQPQAWHVVVGQQDCFHIFGIYARLFLDWEVWTIWY